MPGFLLAVFLAIAGGVFLIMASKSQGAEGPANPEPAVGGSLEAKVKQLSSAVAYAEGYWDRAGNVLSNNVPARFNNPGDLSPGDAPGFSSVFTDGSNVVEFPSVVLGWQYLYAKWRRILSGNSHTYGMAAALDKSFEEIGAIYSGDPANWSKNVAEYLGVTPSTTLRQWLNL